jgi:hypothetical protein
LQLPADCSKDGIFRNQQEKVVCLRCFYDLQELSQSGQEVILCPPQKHLLIRSKVIRALPRELLRKPEDEEKTKKIIYNSLKIIFLEK